MATLEAVLAAREVPLGGPRRMTVRRTLPHRDRRTVGAWCFADHYGPRPAAGERGMHVPPHPHVGLQTVTWLFEGDVLHRDSVGSRQAVRPGELNLMTAGHGIAHAEDSAHPSGSGAARLHGLQLWVALPGAARDDPPRFEHHGTLPRVEDGPLLATVVVGELAGERSAATTYSPLLGADLVLAAGSTSLLPVDPEFEHGVLAVEGDLTVDGEPVPARALAVVARGRRTLKLGTVGGARAFLLGGTPFEEPLLMWWNFVAREHEEIVQARADWEGHRRFGAFDYPGDERLAAPALPTTRLLPRPPARG